MMMRLRQCAAEEIEAHYQGDFFGHARLYREAVLLMRNAGGGSLAACATIANRWVIDYDGGMSLRSAPKT